MIRESAKKILLVASMSYLAASLSGCALLKKNKGGDKFHSSAFNDKNQAPKWMSPPENADEVSKLDPSQMQAQADFHFSLGETYSLAGNTEKAIEEFRLTLIYDPKSAGVRTRLAREYLRKGLLNEAIEQAEEAVQLDSEGLQQRELLGKIYANLKLYDKALEQYKKVIQLSPKSDNARLFIGAILAEKGQVKEAVQHFKKLSKDKTFEKTHLAHYYIGKIEQQSLTSEALKKALSSFKKSLKAKEDFADAAISVAKIHLHKKERKKAVKILSDYQQKYEANEKVAEILSNLYMDAQEHDKAFAQFEILEALHPNELNIKMKMALILMEKKDFTKATDYLKGILLQEPRLDKVRFYLAAVYEEMKRYPEAIANFIQIPAMSQYYADSVIHSSYLYKLQGDLSQAVERIEEGLAKRSDVFEFYTMYASLLDETKKYKEAVKMLEEANERFADNTQLLFYLGSMYDKVGNTEKTIDVMKQVLALDENYVQALNYLAYTYAENDKSLDEAEKLVRRALKLTPNDGYIMDTLGWVLFKQGDIAKALPILEKAYELKKDESIIAEHLGDAYYRYQLPEKAKKMYYQAVKNESNADTIRKIQSKIRSIEQASKGKPAARVPASNP